MREQATYALLSKQVDLALQLAKDNWQQQRETADIVLYATAAIEAGSQEDIKLIRQFMIDTKFEYSALEQALRLGKINGCLHCSAEHTQNVTTQKSGAQMMNKDTSL